jgi:hypothetical protein
MEVIRQFVFVMRPAIRRIINSSIGMYYDTELFAQSLLVQDGRRKSLSWWSLVKRGTWCAGSLMMALGHP